MLGIFLDIETNGLNPFKHKVIEIAFKIVDVESGKLVDSYSSVVFQTQEQWQSSDLQSLQVNGFNWEDVSFGTPREEVSKQIQENFARNGIQRGKAVFICQNPSFDRPFFAQLVDPELQEKLLWPYHWLDLASMHWAVALEQKKKNQGQFPWEIGITKDKIAKAYKIPSESRPHRALNGVDHLIACYKAVVGFDF